MNSAFHQASKLCEELGLEAVSMTDLPKLVAALHRVYGAGQRDGADQVRAWVAAVSDEAAQ